MRLAGFVVFLSSVATAQPKPDCVPSNAPRWVVGTNQATACFPSDNGSSEQCFSIAPGRAPAKVAAPPIQKPIVTRSRAELRDVNGTPSACLGARCTSLGTKAAAAVAAVKATLPTLAYPNGNLESADEAVLVSGDGKALVIEEGGTRAVWSIAGDKVIDLARPSKNHVLMRVEVASGALFATWSDCAGPCGKTILVDSSGKNHGAWFPAGRAIGLDDNRVAIVPTDEGAVFRVLEAATGRQLATLPVKAVSRAIRIDDKTLLLLRTGTDPKDQGGIWELRFITVPPGKPAVLGAAQLLSWCRP
jgi:hypothetical protein